MWRVSRVTWARWLLLILLVEVTLTPRCKADIELDTVGLGPKSITRRSSHVCRSIEKGQSSHQPWLIMVLLKLKFGGVGRVNSVVITGSFFLRVDRWIVVKLSLY